MRLGLPRRRVGRQSFRRRGDRRRGRGMMWWPIAAAIAYGAYYYFSNQQVNPETGEQQLIDMSIEEEMALGLQSYKQIMGRARLSPDVNVQSQIREIGERLSKVIRADQGFTWEFNVIEDSSPNAFCLPGGKVGVHTGIIPVAKNIDGLAVVMGHEIAHATLRHGAQRMARQKLIQVGGMAVSVATGGMDMGSRDLVMGAFGMGAQYGASLPFSRGHESEADRLGLMYVAKACYDPREAPKLWERMGKASSGNKPAEFASTHPSSETRIRQFNDWMPEAIAVYNAHCAEKL